MRCAFRLSPVVLMLLPCVAAAETLRIDPALTMEISFPGERWVLSREAPDFLVEEMKEHLGHELAGQGKTPDDEQLTKAALQRLAANEAFLCNPQTHACLLIDFSPLRQGEVPPGRRTVADSARFAGEGLADEEGVSEVSHADRRCRVRGAETARRVDATFRQHGEGRRFIGVVGFRSPFWFYFYYTDTLRDPKDFAEMEEILGSVALVGPGS